MTARHLLGELPCGYAYLWLFLTVTLFDCTVEGRPCSSVSVRFINSDPISLAASRHSLPRYVSSECLPDWRSYAGYDFENLVMSGGGSKGYAYIGALKVRQKSLNFYIQRHKPHTAAAAALFMSQTAGVQPIGRKLTLRPQTDLRPTNHTQPWSAV